MPGAPDSEARAALGTAAHRLRNLDLSGPARLVARLMVAALRWRRPDDVLESVARWRLDLRQLDGALADVEDRALAVEKQLAAGEPLGPTWWRLRIDDLVRDRQAGASEATSRWVATWLQALVSEEWDRCEQVLVVPGGSDLERKLVDPMTRLTAALRADELWNVPFAVSELLDRDVAVLGTETKVKLGVLHTRALLYGFSNRKGAWREAGKTLAVARTVRRPGRTSWLETVAIAAAAEVRVEQDETEAAEQLIGQALKSDEPAPDAYIAAALLAMAQDLPDHANELYDEAIVNATGPAAVREGVDLAKPQLLRQVPANLLWRLSRVADDPATALSLLERAIDQGIRGDGPAPAREALNEKAKLLRDAGRPETGAAYYAAGIAFSEAGSPARARALLKKACQFDPEVAEHHWSYADVLREHAVDADGVVDPKPMQSAARHLADGFDIRLPRRSEAWVLLSAALIASATRKPDGGQDPSLLCERALLLDPENQIAHGFLATFLRLASLPKEALDAATEGLQSGYGHPYTAARQVAAQLDREAYPAALADATRSLADWPGNMDLIVHHALALIRLERYADALAILTGEDERLPYLRAGCLALLGDKVGARTEARATWVDRDLLASRAVAAWAAFQCGELDDAIAIQSDLMARSTVDPSHRRDLGQMLLARGNDGDELAEGERLLREGIDAATTIDELVHMTTMEFGLLRRILPAGRSLPVLADLTRAAGERIEKLRVVTRPDSDPSELAARARTAMAVRDPVTALGLYERLYRLHEIPEARLGLERAAQALLERGDRAVHDKGDLESARRDWQRLTEVADLLDEQSTIRAELASRLAFAAVELDGSPLPPTIADLAHTEDYGSSVLEEAFKIFARDVPSWWAHREALLDSAGEAGGWGETVDLSETVERLPLDQVYLLRRDAVPEPDMLPFVSPIEVRLDPGHAQLVDSVELADAIEWLRTDLTRDMGVQTPGVRVARGHRVELPAQLLVYDQVVAERRLAENPDDAVAELVETLERAVRAQLYRLVVADDIPLWLRFWDPTGSVPDWMEPPTPGARLRVARVLRLLLRENVPVVDRDLILAGCREMENSTIHHGPMDTLRVVRRRLGAGRLGLAAGVEPVVLPAELQERAAAGLNPEGTWAWTMERKQAAELVADLRAWLDGRFSVSGVVAISVDDHRLRPFVWRLLATEAARIRIFAAEELS